MTIDEMKNIKQQLGLTNEALADLSGVPLGTVQKIMAGTTRSPRRETLLALEEALQKQLAIDPLASTGSSQVSDGSHAYVATSQKEYTLDDWLALPEDALVELIDGKFYNLAIPTRPHNYIAGGVFYQMKIHMDQHEGNCLPELGHVAVQLDSDDKTMVLPDLLVTCEEEKRERRWVVGAPDFVMEVLSPSNAGHDLVFKLNKYMNAGVREYWIVDPANRAILVYDFRQDPFPKTYHFDDQVPVAISDGELSIDFSRIARGLDRYFK